MRRKDRRNLYSSALCASSAKGAQALGPEAKTAHSLARLDIESNCAGDFREDDVNEEIIAQAGLLVCDEISMLGAENWARLRATVQLVKARRAGVGVQIAQTLAPGAGGAILVAAGNVNNWAQWWSAAVVPLATTRFSRRTTGGR
jgi:hypothetical protein